MHRRCIVMLLSIVFSSIAFSQTIRFTSAFESGSLDKTELIDSVWLKCSSRDSILNLSYNIFSRFDPYNPVDTSLKPSARWYYFRMEGVKGKNIYLNINNSEAIRPFYSYDNLNFHRFLPEENFKKNQINKIFEKDTVYIAHFIPYTLSRLDKKLNSWAINPFAKRDTIGLSTQGRPIEMITLTDSSVNSSSKKKVWIHGRAHPSEQPCSWHLEALIDRLLSGSPHSEALLRNVIFYIVPIINPDGVFGGYSRSSSTGVNIEINWDRPDSMTMPEIKVLKNKLEEITGEAPLDLLLNMHSQIANSATYWIHTDTSTNPKSYREQLLLSNLTAFDNPYYSSKDQLFSDVAPRYAEGWIWNRFKDSTVAITFETPYTYYNEEIDGEWVSPENLSDFAQNTLYAIGDYLEVSSYDRIIADVIPSKGKWSIISDNSMVYFGDSMYRAKSRKAKVKIALKDATEGTYKLYNWMPGPAEKVSRKGSNMWKETGVLTIRNGGSRIIRLKSKDLGNISDKILLVK